MKSRLLTLERDRSALIAEQDKMFEKISNENRRMTDDEKKADDKFIADVASLDDEIAREKRRLEVERRETPRHAEAEPKSAAERIKDGMQADGFTGLGEFLQAVYNAGRAGGFVDPRLKPAAATPSGASEGVSSDGGYLVRKDVAGDLFTLAHETGLLSRSCRRIPISTDANGVTINAVDESSRATGSRWGGIRAYWASEAEAATKSKPAFRQVELKLEKLMGLFYSTDELLKDAAALEAIARQGFAEEFGFQLDDAILRGDGAGKPLGILNSGALISQAAEGGQAADTIVYNNVINMFARCWARSYPNAVWYINQACYPQLFRMNLRETGDTAGTAVWLPPGGASASPYGTLLGRPVMPIEQASALGDVGDIMLLDLSQYVLAEKGGVETASSIHVKFVEDETVFRWILRVDGQPIWKQALTPFKGANSLSPFVALAAR